MEAQPRASSASSGAAAQLSTPHRRCPRPRRFSEASELMALRSRLGGEARLQQAICLDSLGRNGEAYEIYKRIENHPAPGVAKKAKRWVRQRQQLAAEAPRAPGADGSR